MVKEMKKGMSMSINVIILLVISLVILLIMITIVSSSGMQLTSTGEEKIVDVKSVTECQIACWQCQRSSDPTVCGTVDDLVYNSNSCVCN